MTDIFHIVINVIEHKNENSLIYYKDIMPDINDTNKEEKIL